MSDILPLERVSAAITPMQVELRRAGMFDALLLGALAKRIWQAHYPAILTQDQIDYMLELMYSPESLHQQIMEEAHEFWIVEADDMPVGYMSLSQEEEGHWHLHKLYVDKELHGIGIGSRMLQHAIGLYAPKQLSLGVNRDNTNSINFYFRHGFTIEGTKNTDIGNGFVMEDFVMVRRG